MSETDESGKSVEMPRIQFLTCSYSGDFEACELLCESIDRFVPDEVTHQVFVPERDLEMFSHLANSRRVIYAQEDLLPKWFWKVPLPSPEWRRRLHLPRRNVYLTPYHAVVRGWIAQQIMKIAATLQSHSDVVAHVDSDNFFVRPFDPSILVPGGKTRFYAGVDSLGLATHEPWYSAAARMLDLDDSNLYTADYIDQFVVWRRPLVEAMIGQIEATTGRRWIKTLASTPQFAEYVLYGVFVEHVVGVESAGLRKQTNSLCHTLWTGEQSDDEALTALVESLRPEHASCAIQSTVPIAADQRRETYRRLTKRAAEQGGPLPSDDR